MHLLHVSSVNLKSIKLLYALLHQKQDFDKISYLFTDCIHLNKVERFIKIIYKIFNI